MLKRLVHKELRLNVPWQHFLFAALALLLLIPSWPFAIAFMFIYVPMMIVPQTDRANSDLLFAALLPVRKRDIVVARAVMLVALEAAFLAVGALAAVGRYWLYDADNIAGMNPNAAFFGLVLVMYAVFNAIYLPGGYKAAYRLLWPLLGGSVVAVAVGLVLTTLPAVVPQLAGLNDRGLGNLPAQALVLGVGLGVYAVTTAFACRRAAANFERVDL